MARVEKDEVPRSRGPTSHEIVRMANLEELERVDVQKTDEGPAIGIDLGTTYSRGYVFRGNGRFVPLKYDQRHRNIAAYVAFPSSGGRRLVGNVAKEQVETEPATPTVFNAKRLIGRRFDDPSIQKDKRLLPFKLSSSTAPWGNEAVMINVTHEGQWESQYPAETISSMVLRNMKEIAEKRLKQTVEKAVISVPAYFNDSQRQATLKAGALSGLKVMCLINEPTALALGSLFHIKIPGKTILIFDLGGGSLDVSVITTKERVVEVKAGAGDTLGGVDFDNRLVDHFIQKFEQKYSGKQITRNPRTLHLLRTAAEEAKKKLSTEERTTIDLKSLHEGMDLSIQVTRRRFEKLNFTLFKKCIYMVEKCLNEAKMRKDQVDKVCLRGGSTEIPIVRNLLLSFFGGRQSIFLETDSDSDIRVARGAAIQAAMLCGWEGWEDFKILDITAHSLGLRSKDGSMTALFPRNTIFPTDTREEALKLFTTGDNDLARVFIQLYEGERKRARDNNKLEKHWVAGIPPAFKGAEKFTLGFSINRSGVVVVSPGASNLITVTRDKQEYEGGRDQEVPIDTQENPALNEEEEEEEEEEGVRKKFEAKMAILFRVYNIQNTINDHEQRTALSGPREMIRQWREKLTEVITRVYVNVDVKVDELERKLEGVERQMKVQFKSSIIK